MEELSVPMPRHEYGLQELWVAPYQHREYVDCLIYYHVLSNHQIPFGYNESGFHF